MATARSDLDVRVRGVDQLTPSLSKIESRIIRFVGAASSALAAVKIVGFPVTAVKEFERQMANVQKTTGFTDKEIQKLGASLQKMSQRIDVSATDLAKIAAAAGQQGLGREGTEGVLAFTDSVSRMSSVLDITVEEAGAAVGKLASIFKVPLTEIERLISSMNEVANNSTATGDQLIDVTRRIGDAAGAFDDYYKTIGIGAAAIDFGASAEVVGTSLTKVFADMQSKAEKFSAFMGMSTKEWISIVQSDGINAFKMYLDRLRELEGASRQRMIRELSGTGRIGAMLNKFVNDTTNTVLDRNLASAQRGKETGTSALREQATVLKTLDAQAKILGNTFRNLGIQAGERFAKPLTAMVAQLAESLQNPAIISFADKLGEMFLGLFKTIQETIVYLASLNVNWENFVVLAKALVAIKLTQIFVSWISRLPVLSTLLQSTAKSAGDLKKNMDGIDQPKGLFASFKSIVDGYKAQATAVDEQRTAVNNLKQAEAERAAAQAAHNRNLANRQVANSDPAIQAAVTDLGAARRAAAQSRNAAMAAETAAITAHQTRVTQRQQQYQQRLAQLDAEYQRRRTALREAGNTTELRALTRAHNLQLQDEQRTYERSMTQINAYHARRLAAVRAAAMAEAAARATAVNAAERNVLQTNRAAGTANAATAAALSGQALSKSTEKVAEATAALDALNKVAKFGGKFLAGLSAGFKLLGASLGWLLSMASRITWVGFFVYQLADMLGLVEKVTPWLLKLASALGLYSEESRKAAQAEQDRVKAMANEEREVQNLIDRYDELKDASTGQLRETDVAALPTMLKDDNQELGRQALEEITTALKGAAAVMQRGDIQKVSLLEDEAEFRAKLANAEKAYSDALTRMKSIQDRLPPAQLASMESAEGPAGGVTPLMRQFARARKEVEDMKKQLDDLNKVGTQGFKDMGDSIETVTAAAKKDLASLTPVLEGMFTKETADIFVRYGGRIADLQKQLAELKEAHLESAQAEIAAGEKGEEELAKQKARTSELVNQITSVQSEIQKSAEGVNEEIKKLEGAKEVSPALINSLAYLRKLLSLGPEDLLALQQAIALLQETGAVFTGANAPNPPRNPQSGDGEYGSKDAAQKRLAKARLALLKAQTEAEAKLQKEANDEQLSQIQYLYDRSMLSIREFYGRKKQLQLEDIAISTRLAQEELKGAQAELASAADELGRVQAQTAIVRLEGDIRALNARKEYVAAQINRDLELAKQAFGDELANSVLSVSTFFGAEDSALFSQALATYENQYRDFINRLKVEAEDMPELLPLIDQVKLRNDFMAASLVVGEIGRGLSADTGLIDRYADRLEMLRQKGVITTGDLAKGMDAVRMVQVELYKSSVARMEQQLKDLPQESLAYKELALQIDDARLSMEKLALESNAVAKEINEGFTNELSSMFQNFKLSDDIGDTLMNTLLGFLQTLQNTLGQALAEGIMGALNQGLGGDGIGGLFANIFGMAFGGPEAGPTGTIADPLYVATSPLAGGGLPGQGAAPTIDVGGLFGSNAGDDPLGDFITQLDGVMTPVPQEMGGFFSQFMGGFSNSISDFLSGAGSLFNSLLNGLGNVFSSIFGGGGGGGLLGSLFSSIGLFHSGGKVGGWGSRRSMRVPAGLFAGAPRYHSGTAWAGLKPGEVPAVLEEGETVRTQEQERMLQRQLGGAGGRGGGPESIKSVLIMDPNMIPDAMQAAPGEKVVMTHIRKNLPTIRQMLGSN